MWTGQPVHLWPSYWPTAHRTALCGADAAACRPSHGGCSLGLNTDIRPLFSHSATGEFNSPPKSLRAPKKCPPNLYGRQKSARVESCPSNPY
eukprot:2989488-Pyramimonas_sp.AAC.1